MAMLRQSSAKDLCSLLNACVNSSRGSGSACKVPRGFRLLWGAIGDIPGVVLRARSLTEFSRMRPKLQSEPIPYQQQIPEWNPALRIALSIQCGLSGTVLCATQIVTSLFSATQGDIPDPGTLCPLRPLVVWTAGHIFHVAAPLSLEGNSASGDCMFGWVTAFCLLVIAAFATVIWSVLDRKRKNYAALHKWVRLFFRFVLAGQMLNYGLAKVIPLQMPYPSLTKLLQPFGTFSPMGVLWSSIGAAPAYEIFAGCAEVIGGVLLIVPRTATLGALICL